MITCTKAYTDIPFAHRQPSHDGHCALIHGHNWSFVFTFASTKLDVCGFVVDFGKLKWLRAWIDENFDHALLLNANDPRFDELRAALGPDRIAPLGLANITMVPDCSCEGLAKWLFEEVNEMLFARTNERVYLTKVQVIEDSRNSATYSNLDTCKHD